MLKITISGPAGCGKTTVAKVIEERLAELGFCSFLDDTDKVDPGTLVRRIDSLKGKDHPVLIAVKQDYRKAKNFTRGDPGGTEKEGEVCPCRVPGSADCE